jgi:hypothetical protein
MNNFQKSIAAASLTLVVVFALAIPSGAAISRPSASTGHSAVVSHVVKAKPKIKKVAFKGSYKGTISMLMVGASGQSASSVKVTSLHGTGTGTDLGTSTVSATGSAPAANQCDELIGVGSISGSGSKILLKVVTSSANQGCAAATSTPTSVSVQGVAKVTGGTGKFKGVSGSLSFKGTFNVQSNTSGSSESDAFTATLTGPLTIKS